MKLPFLGFVISLVLGFYFDNPYFLILTAGFLIWINTLIQKEQNKIWNNGICDKYNEPWIFSHYNDYFDGYRDSVYKCRDEIFIKGF